MAVHHLRCVQNISQNGVPQPVYRNRCCSSRGSCSRRAASSIQWTRPAAQCPTQHCDQGGDIHIFLITKPPVAYFYCQMAFQFPWRVELLVAGPTRHVGGPEPWCVWFSLTCHLSPCTRLAQVGKTKPPLSLAGPLAQST